MKSYTWIYPVFGMLVALIAIYMSLVRSTEPFYGMSPGTLTQLQSSHVATIPAPGVLPETILVPLQHRFKPYDQFGAENAALQQTPMPYLIY
jgi:hypothetical protein